MGNRSRAAIFAVICALGIGFWTPSVRSADRIGDIFVIALENHNANQPASFKRTEPVYHNPHAPYIDSLITPGNPNAAQTSYATHFYNIQHPSEPNYLWTVSGSGFGIHNDRDPFPDNEQKTTKHLAGLLQLAGVSWKSYQEDIDRDPKTGAPLPRDQWTVPLKSCHGMIDEAFPANPYNGTRRFDYASKHDPCVYFVDTSGGDDLTTSNPEVSHYVPLRQLQEDLKNNTVGRFNWITPDEYNEMHSQLPNGWGGLHGDAARVALGDHVLSILIPEIKASRAYKNNGLIVIWCDETAGGDTHDFTLPYIIISPLARGNAYACNQYMSHLSDLRTFQEILQLRGDTPTGYLGDACDVTDQSDMFKPGVIPNSLPAKESLDGNHLSSRSTPR